jgi:hypothetical protein
METTKCRSGFFAIPKNPIFEELRIGLMKKEG